MNPGLTPRLARLHASSRVTFSPFPRRVPHRIRHVRDRAVNRMERLVWRASHILWVASASGKSGQFHDAADEHQIVEHRAEESDDNGAAPDRDEPAVAVGAGGEDGERPVGQRGQAHGGPPRPASRGTARRPSSSFAILTEEYHPSPTRRAGHGVVLPPRSVCSHCTI